MSDACDARAALPELNLKFGPGLAGSTVNTTNPYCHVAYGVLTQLRGLAAYTIPKVDVQVSGVMQSKPGALLAANYAFPAAQVAAALGRPVAGNPQNVTVNSSAGFAIWRPHQPTRFPCGEDLPVRRAAFNVGVDVYNTLNSNAVLSYNNTFVPNNPVRGCSRFRSSRAGWPGSAQNSRSNRGRSEPLSAVASPGTQRPGGQRVRGDQVGPTSFAKAHHGSCGHRVGTWCMSVTGSSVCPVCPPGRYA